MIKLTAAPRISDFSWLCVVLLGKQCDTCWGKDESPRNMSLGGSNR